LRLEVGDIVKVTKMAINGQWEGELSGKVCIICYYNFDFLMIKRYKEISETCFDKCHAINISGWSLSIYSC
jgi:hypothetical protein